MFFIVVEGNIIIRGGMQRAYGLACGRGSREDIESLVFGGSSSPDQFDGFLRYIEGDLELTKENRAIPYAYYVAGGDAVLAGETPKTDFIVGEGYQSSFSYWEENIESIRRKCLLNVPDEFAPTFYNGLFVECFSSLELLLCDVLLSLIYTNEACYQKAEVFWRIKTESKVNDQETIEKIIHKYISERVYHQFEKIDLMYNLVANVSLPDYAELRQRLHQRNNIVHRHALSNLNWMTKTNASIEDIKSLVEIMDKFALELKMKVERIR